MKATNKAMKGLGKIHLRDYDNSKLKPANLIILGFFLGESTIINLQATDMFAGTADASSRNVSIWVLADASYTARLDLSPDAAEALAKQLLEQAKSSRDYAAL